MSIQKVVNAIREIDYNRNFKIEGNNIDDCIIEWINGSKAISKDDIKAKMQDIEDNGTVLQQTKNSGKAKLKSGEKLTDAEISALFGN
jgi:hypothetical protein